jgi:hypothetical protein
MNWYSTIRNSFAIALDDRNIYIYTLCFARPTWGLRCPDVTGIEKRGRGGVCPCLWFGCPASVGRRRHRSEAAEDEEGEATFVT